MAVAATIPGPFGDRRSDRTGFAARDPSRVLASLSIGAGATHWQSRRQEAGLLGIRPAIAVAVPGSAFRGS
jgi:uncharacterized membrane protein YjjB (DUF3815 family)